ncbi:hypothetical protein C8F04DRAFT_1191831 [Mycena alexandri]|uniref:Uncharacterized protein n=1 Tax=Mycena alexandri TaxID=1745969 RepID=A0AAD6SC67_9AGAR|nr:hypothetical protein C8F04DRAFT_1191831 [Mycena alexandri]
MTQFTSTEGVEAPSVDLDTDAATVPVPDALASGVAQVPGSAAQAYSMLSLVANALATAAGLPPQPSPAPTSGSYFFFQVFLQILTNARSFPTTARGGTPSPRAAMWVAPTALYSPMELNQALALRLGLIQIISA